MGRPRKSVLVTGLKFAIPILTGVLIWLLPHPAAVTLKGWHMLALFLATIFALITKPMPNGTIAILGLTLTVLTGTVTTKNALAGFSDSSVWLIVMAFFIARGFMKTGLGSRVAYLFVKLFGKKTLGLAYSLIACDLVLAPATPSNTARAGGIIYPILRSISEAFGSKPGDHTERELGAFLTYTEFQGDLITSAMFLTAMSGNPLAASISASLGVQITWMKWFIAGIVPGIISLIFIPLLIYWIYPPKIKKVPNASVMASEKLKEMGPLSRNEKNMLLCFAAVLLLWICGGNLGIDATITAFIGVSLLLLLRVLDWPDMIKEKSAWNIFIWFSVLVDMANQLNSLGIIKWFSTSIGSLVHGMSWPAVLFTIVVVYFFSTYLFAGGVAHISAMFSALLGVAIAAGVPGTLAALVLGFFSNLNGSSTNYSIGPAPVLYASGYVSQNRWWGMNLFRGLYGDLAGRWQRILAFDRVILIHCKFRKSVSN